MKSIYLQELELENYRNFSNFKIKASNECVIIIGENGTGKTNILEAISLFSPGRGLRNAKFEEICKIGQEAWLTNGLFQSKLGDAQISSQFSKNSIRRTIQFNGSKITNSELCKFVNIIWLTPRMENIFFEGISSRRKFFDRIVYSFYQDHASKIQEYEYYTSERLKILQQDISDVRWLSVVENKIAHVSLKIAKSRISVLQEMQSATEELISEFPKSLISIEGTIESMLDSHKEEDILNHIQYRLLDLRLKDKLSGRTNFGIHRSDFLITHKEKNKPAKLCSTGEQKAMLISVTLAQINLSLKIGGCRPILLLDEIFVHLDDRRKEYLIDFLGQANLQSWITATDFSGIEKLKNVAKEVSTEDSCLV